MQSAFATEHHLRCSFSPANHQAPLQNLSRTARDFLEFMWLLSDDGKKFAKCSQKYLADHFDCSWRTAHRRINELKEKGYIFPVTRNGYMVIQWAVSLLPKFAQETAPKLPMIKWFKGALKRFWKAKKSKNNPQQNQIIMSYPPDKNVIDTSFSIKNEEVSKTTPPLNQVTIQPEKLADTNNQAILRADCHMPDKSETMHPVMKEEAAPSQAPKASMKESTRSKVEGILNNQELNDHRKIVKLVQLCEEAGKPLDEELTPKLFNNAPEALKLFKVSMETNTPIKTLLEASDAFQTIPDIKEAPHPVNGIRTPEKITSERSINMVNYVADMAIFTKKNPIIRKDDDYEFIY